MNLKEITPILSKFMSRTMSGVLSARNRIGELLFGLIITALICLTSFAAYKNAVEKGWGADTAAWAQAAGSIIAIAGAAWLAGNEARQARRWRRKQGEEAAWGVRFVIAQAQFDSQIIAAELTDPKGWGSNEIDIWRQLVANVSLALQTLLARTDHIHPSVILTTCNAKILIDRLSSDLEKLSGKVTRDEVADIELISDIVGIHLNLAELLSQHDARMRGVNQALDSGQDMLPIREWGK